ncbi:hypothetical protein [Psychrobacter sp. 72-O-c]|uniref:hypothetical protein n=1 Tax=Psychrobacter sp. 72-O-c TaxID=2774125 RepID=UPI001918B915|nr:hypothetical protein [Psychrobacter sp. 72-O-c]
MNSDPNSSVETPTSKLMNNQEAINIIQALVDGINPLSDEPLSSSSLCLNSDIQRALQATIPALESKIRADVRKSNLPINAGKPWNSEEDQQLIDAFDNGDSIVTLVEYHQRTKGSITSRLGKLGKIID